MLMSTATARRMNMARRMNTSIRSASKHFGDRKNHGRNRSATVSASDERDRRLFLLAACTSTLRKLSKRKKERTKHGNVATFDGRCRRCGTCDSRFSILKVAVVLQGQGGVMRNAFLYDIFTLCDNRRVDARRPGSSAPGSER